jgi:hypothetical protein
MVSVVDRGIYLVEVEWGDAMTGAYIEHVAIFRHAPKCNDGVRDLFSTASVAVYGA